MAGDAEGSMNAANILKPALSRGELQVIGATTFNEYRKHIEKDAGPGISLEGMMLKLKLQYFGHMRKVDSLEKTLMLGGIGGKRRRE